MKKRITYEQPLNERIRTWLRLEHLFSEMSYRLKGPSEWDSRAVIDNLITIIDFADRFDFKAELLKDFELHLQTLQRWKSLPEVNTERLNQLFEQVNQCITQLQHFTGPLSTHLNPHPLLNLIRLRQSILGGTSRSDLPAYYHWLQKNPKQRHQEITEWLTPLDVLQDALILDLYMIRNNAVTYQEIATRGLFQSKLEANTTHQLIQVSLPLEHSCYPEINGGKQRFTVRFYEQPSVEKRAVATEQDVNFELACCML